MYLGYLEVLAKPAASSFPAEHEKILVVLRYAVPDSYLVVGTAFVAVAFATRRRMSPV